MKTLITVPDTHAGRTIKAALGRLAIVRPVASDSDNYGHVQGENAAQIVRALRVSFSDLVWSVAPSR